MQDIHTVKTAEQILARIETEAKLAKTRLGDAVVALHRDHLNGYRIQPHRIQEIGDAQAGLEVWGALSRTGPVGPALSAPRSDGTPEERVHAIRERIVQSLTQWSGSNSTNPYYNLRRDEEHRAWLDALELTDPEARW